MHTLGLSRSLLGRVRFFGAASLLIACGGGESTNGGGGGVPGTGGSGGATGGSAGASGGAAGSTGGAAGTSAAGGAAGSAGSGPSCPATHLCAPSIPSGWIGPVVLGKATTLPDCPSVYPTTEKEAKADLAADPAVCGCSCGSGTGTCAAARRVGYAANNCSGPQGSTALTPGQCWVTSSGTTTSFDQPDMTGKSCPATPTKTIPTAAFADAVAVCGGAADVGGCDPGQICIPRADTPFTTGCVYKDGDQACPVGYPNKHVSYDSFSDTRDCSSCTCSASGGSCTASFTAFQTPSCTGASMPVSTPQDGAAFGTCAATNWTAVRYNSTSATNPTCAPSSSTPTGEVTPTDAVTTCCAD